VPERVPDEVGDDLVQLGLVAGEDEVLRRVHGDRAFRSFDGGVGHDVGDDARQVDRRAFGLPALAQAGEAKELVDQDAHAPRLVLDAPHRRLEVGGIVLRPATEDLGVAADRSQGRAQLVRSVGEKAAQLLFGPAPLLEGLLDLLEHRVEGEAQAADLGLVLGRLDAARQVAGRDLAGRRRHVFERPQASPDEP